MATLHSSPFSIRLTYDLKVYPLVEGNEWHFYYIIEPLLYGQPFLRPNVLKRWKQPHGTFSVFDGGPYCTISKWLQKALKGGKSEWCSLEPPDLTICLLPAMEAHEDSLTRFELTDLNNVQGNVNTLSNYFLLQWRFNAGYFNLEFSNTDCSSPFVIDQWISRQQLELFIQELKEELANALKAAGVELR
jgi:hypothetical protein